MLTVSCSNCKKEFYYEVTDMRVPGGKDKEYILCPYCGHVNGSVMTSGFVFTYKEKAQEKGGKLK